MNAKESDEPLWKRTYDEMTADLKSVADEFSKSTIAENRGILLSKHNQGQLLLRVEGDELRYGLEPLQQLATYLDEDVKDLYRVRAFAQTFDRKTIEAWSQRRTATGG